MNYSDIQVGDTVKTPSGKMLGIVLRIHDGIATVKWPSKTRSWGTRDCELSYLKKVNL